MTNYSIDITKLAERDIWDAVSYIQEVLFQPESAKRIYHSIKEQISSLSTMPDRYACRKLSDLLHREREDENGSHYPCSL